MNLLLSPSLQPPISHLLLKQGIPQVCGLRQTFPFLANISMARKLKQGCRDSLSLLLVPDLQFGCPRRHKVSERTVPPMEDGGGWG